MSRRSAPGASILAALFVIGLAVWVLSLIWVYLVIGGAAALVGWVGWSVTRTLRAPEAPPRLVTVQAPRMAPPPEEYYRVVSPVEPRVFDDPRSAEEAALRTFTVWAQHLPMAPEDPSDLVRSLEMRVRLIGRLVTEAVQRKATWLEAPGSGWSQLTQPKVAAEALDPWVMSPEALKSASRHVAPCSRCAGDGKISCATCGGTTRAPCGACNGAGKAYGYTANNAYRLLNCKSCKGKGDLKCTSCKKGKVDCPACEGSGRCERWLEVTETVRYDVQIEPDGEMTRAFRWGTDGTPATRAEIELDAKIAVEIASDSALLHEEIARRVPSDWLEVNWQRIQPRLRPEERIRRQTFWLLEVPSIELSYSLAGTSPTLISFEGRRMLAPPPAIDRQFIGRAQRIRLIRYLLIGLCLAVPVAYLLRGAYFRSWWVAALALCTAGIAIVIEGFVRQATLGRQGARRWAAAIAAGAALACACAVGAEPSLRAARRYISAGQFELAETELRAFGREQEAAQAQTWADLRLARLLRGSDLTIILGEAAQIPEGSAQRARADRHIREVVTNAVKQHLSEGKLATAEAMLALGAPTLRRTVEGRAHLADLRARAQDLRYQQCGDDSCRWQVAVEAVRASPTDAWRKLVSEARASIIQTLEFHDHPDQPPLDRVRQLQQLGTLAKIVEKIGGDEEIVTKARMAAARAHEEREKIRLIGAPREVVAELLGAPTAADAAPPRTTLSRVAVYSSLRGDRCVGLYLVGDSPKGRVLNDADHAAATAQILSQALGHKVALPNPPRQTGGRAATLSKWKDGGITVVARWSGRDLMELRVGDASP